MTERMRHAEYVATQRRRVAELAQQIIAGEIDVLDGSWQIAALRFEVEIEDRDQDFIPFVVVESETDHLPIGAEALNWSDEALIRKEPELKQAREWAREIVLASCVSLVARFANASRA
jgi:GH43 family beta-xylosidase